MKHTPGPWEQDLSRIVTSEGKHKIASISPWPSAKTHNANAHLIAAAPELLEALKRFIESSPCQNNCSPTDMSCDTQFAKQAITKAEGA